MVAGRLEKILRGFRKGAIIAGLATSLFLSSCSEDEKITSPVTTPKPPTTPIQQNRPPVITSSPVTSVSEKEYYGYQVQATDPDGDNLTYFVNKPSWLLVSGYGYVSGAPPEVSADQPFEVEISVSDGKESVKQNYNLTVKNVSNSYLLSESQLSGATVSENAVSLSQPVSYAVGDIIGSGITTATPNGLLREITSISSDKKILQTTQATLEQVASTAFVTYSGRLLPSSLVYSSLLDGISMSQLSTKGFNFNIKLSNVVLYDFDGNLNTKNDQLIANGNIAFDTDVIFNANIFNHKIKDINFKNSTTLESDVTIGANVMGVASIYKIKIAECKFKPFVIGYFPPPVPIPIVVVPVLGVYASINPTNVNPLSLRVNQSTSLEVWLSYSSTSGWTPGSNFSNNFSFSNPTVNGNLELKVSAGPQLELMLYGIAGPTADINRKLRFKVSNNAQDWELYAGLGATIGVKMQALKKGLSAQLLEVINYEKLLAKSQTIPPPPPPPTPPTTITIQPGPEGKDAYVRYTLWPDGFKSYSGFGDTPLLEFSYEYAGSHGGEEETLIEFPNSQIPRNVKIASAKLMLYGFATTNSFTNKPTVILSKLIGPWEESIVKWDTKPSESSISNMDFIYEGKESWYELDVTSTVQEWVNGKSNYGFGLSTKENTVYGKVYSSDNSASTKRPKLIISY